LLDKISRKLIHPLNHDRCYIISYQSIIYVDL
jgi:hypothetical protein